jgi:hypothetical protein
MLGVEAIRTAQERFGRKPLIGEQVPWGLEKVNITGQVSCTDHEEARVGRIQTWDGKEWKISSDWYTSDEFDSARRTSWAPCLTQPCVACRHCPVFVSRACRGWRTSPCGPRLAEQRRGPPALLRTPMMRTAKPPSRRTPWQFASEDSWPNAPVGRERPQYQTCCASPPIWPVTISRKKARTGQNIPALSPAGCVACKLLFA